MLFTSSIFIWGMHQQLILGKPWGDKPMSDLALSISGPLFVLISVGVVALIHFIELTVCVRRDGVFIRYFPFHIKGITIPTHEIASAKAVTYNPILEYGGWGIRWGLKAKAYNVSGNKGVMVDIKGKRNILIGSARSEEMEQAIASILG